jgi:hypothetical protein
MECLLPGFPGKFLDRSETEAAGRTGDDTSGQLPFFQPLNAQIAFGNSLSLAIHPDNPKWAHCDAVPAPDASLSVEQDRFLCTLLGQRLRRTNRNTRCIFTMPALQRCRKIANALYNDALLRFWVFGNGTLKVLALRVGDSTGNFATLARQAFPGINYNHSPHS